MTMHNTPHKDPFNLKPYTALADVLPGVLTRSQTYTLSAQQQARNAWWKATGDIEHAHTTGVFLIERASSPKTNKTPKTSKPPKTSKTPKTSKPPTTPTPAASTPAPAHPSLAPTSTPRKLGVYLDNDMLVVDFSVNKELYLIRLAALGFPVSDIIFKRSRMPHKTTGQTLSSSTQTDAKDESIKTHKHQTLPPLLPQEKEEAQKLTEHLPRTLQPAAQKAIENSLRATRASHASHISHASHTPRRPHSS